VNTRVKVITGFASCSEKTTHLICEWRYLCQICNRFAKFFHCYEQNYSAAICIATQTCDCFTL